MRAVAFLLVTAALAACNPAAPDNEAVPDTAPATAPLELTRLDCGSITIKNFDKFFSDRPGLYEAAPRDITDSCYLIRHGDDLMLWDTGLPAELKGTEADMGDMVVRQKTTIAEQLARLGIKPADIDIVGISHSHSDHTGQAAAFPQASLLIGRADYEDAKVPSAPGEESPIAPWIDGKGGGAISFVVKGEYDVFGDGSVVALHLPGHTPGHLALMVNLKSGPVLLSGDLYHSTEARQKRGVPPFNSSREQTLDSMDAFEAKAKQLGAKVVIQHEPRDIAKLPAFPAAAK